MYSVVKQTLSYLNKKLPIIWWEACYGNRSLDQVFVQYGQDFDEGIQAAHHLVGSLEVCQDILVGWSGRR